MTVELMVNQILLSPGLSLTTMTGAYINCASTHNEGILSYNLIKGISNIF